MDIDAPGRRGREGQMIGSDGSRQPLGRLIFHEIARLDTGGDDTIYADNG